MKRETFLFIGIVVVAFILRIFNLGSTPPSLNWDEVSHGYNAYSIIETGKDEWGHQFPLIFRAYGDYKLPVYIYLTALSEMVFGLNEFSVRLVSSIAGVVTVAFTYLLIKRLLSSEKIALLTAFLLAISPWHLFVSRIAVEANLSLALIVSGSYFLLKGIKDKTNSLITAVVLLGLSIWTYNSARIFIPLLLVGTVFIYMKEIIQIYTTRKFLFVFTVFSLLFFFVPMFYQLTNTAGQARYEWVQILDEGAIQQIIEKRNNIQLPGLWPKLLSNKLTYFFSVFVVNYLSHFSPNFLFFEGGSHYQFSIPGIGLLYAINFPFFVIGFFRGLVDLRKSKNMAFVMMWLIIAPVASSLTREAPHVLRSIVMLPMPMLLTSVGLVVVFDFLRNKNKKFALIVAVLYVLVSVLFLKKYLQIYTNDYVREYSSSWQYGYKQAIGYVNNNYDNYDKIIFSKVYGEPHEFVLFYSSWDSEKYRNDPNLNRFYQSNWYWVDGFDKFYFVNDWEIPKEESIFVQESKKQIDCTADTKCLLVTSPGNSPKGWNKLYGVNFLNGAPAFEIYGNQN